MMKKILNILALAILSGALLTWAITGANRGWTKTSVPIKTLDPVTGIEAISYQDKFLPGVDFLGAAALVAAALAASSLFFGRNRSHQSITKK